MTNPEPVNLIYIASIGRSGSTLLESILGAHSRICTMGELHIWPHELRMGGVRPCSCGEFVQKCAFWSEMKRRVDPLQQPPPHIDHFREAHNAGRTLRIKRLADFRKSDDNDKPNTAIDQYAANCEAVFRAYKEVLQEQHGLTPDWVVDSSKDPYRLAWLLKSGRFNIRVIHLVRDPRAFVYSVTRQYREDTPRRAGTMTRWYFTARQSLAWSVQNGLFGRLGRNLLDPKSYLLLNYEELATKPQQTAQAVCDFLGCDYEPDAVEDFRGGGVHTIAGNPMRYEKRAISLDERWKSGLPTASRLIAQSVTVMNRHRFGYR